jgi:hypothetical protein
MGADLSSGTQDLGGLLAFMDEDYATREEALEAAGLRE